METGGTGAIMVSDIGETALLQKLVEQSSLQKLIE